MAGDWIKMRTDLYRDPKVSVIADLLLDKDSDLSLYVSQNLQRDISVTRNVMRNVTVGALVSVWGVLRHRGKRVGDDLVVKGCTTYVIDDLADIPGFGVAMEVVGWVIENGSGLVLPRFFEEFNVDPTDELRAKNAERQRRFREKKALGSNENSNVTVTLKSNAREEKRREEVNPSVAHEKIVFDGSRFQNINGHLALWKTAYPAVSVEAEIAKAAAWLVANPKNKKSAYSRFLNSWLSRAQDKAPRVAADGIGVPYS